MFVVRAVNTATALKTKFLLLAIQLAIVLLSTDRAMPVEHSHTKDETNKARHSTPGLIIRLSGVAGRHNLQILPTFRQPSNV
jgi:hypothetical protein